MAKTFKGSTMPSPLTPTSEKNTEDFGVKVAMGIMGTTADYRESRLKKIHKNKLFSDGNQPVEPYLSQLQIDPKSPRSNIRFKARPIAPKFKKVIVDGYAQKKERIKVESLSKHVQDRKDKKKSDAIFRMEYQNEIKALEEQSGIAVEDPNAFVPDSPEHADIFFALNDREKEELIMQQAINFTLKDNNIDKIKRKVLTQIFESNMFGLYNYIDNNGRLIVDTIAAEDCVHSISDDDEFSDISFGGRMLRMKISDLRSRFKLTEDKEDKLFYSAKEYGGKFGNTSVYGDFQTHYRDSGTRPYDGHTVEVLHFFWEANAEIDEDGLAPLMGYEGWWIVGTDFMLKWGVAGNILRDGEDKEKVLNPFIFHMVDNDGKMDTRSILDFMIDSIEVMDLAILKIKTAIAKARPSGYVIDVAGLVDIDLGEGELTPLELVQIRNETGDTYYNSKDAEGNDLPAPIRDDVVDISVQIRGFVDTYNFELENIRDYTGINPSREGSSVPAKMGLGVMNAQLDSSNTATWSIYTAYTSSLKRLAKQIAIRVSDELRHNSNPNAGLLGILGRDNIDLIRERDDITKSQYDLDIQLEMEYEQRQQRETNIAQALTAGTIELQDAEYIRNIDDYSISMRYLGFFSDKRKKERQEEQLMLSQQNADVQTQAAQAAEEAKQQTVSIESEMKKSIVVETGEQDRLKAMEALAWKLIELSETTGKPISPSFQPIVEKVLGNLGLAMEKESIIREAELDEAEMAEEERLAMAQMSPEEQAEMQGQPV